MLFGVIYLIYIVYIREYVFFLFGVLVLIVLKYVVCGEFWLNLKYYGLYILIDVIF